MAFRSELTRLRESVGASFAVLDRAVGKSNYVARVERGELPIPDRTTVVKLGDLLRELGADTSGAALWEAAAPEAVEALDPGIREYFDAQISVARAQGGDLSESAARLLTAIREVEARDRAHCAEMVGLLEADGMTGTSLFALDVAAALTAVLEGIGAAGEVLRGSPTTHVRTTLGGLLELDPAVRARLMVAVAEMLTLTRLARLSGRVEALDRLKEATDGR